MNKKVNVAVMTGKQAYQKPQTEVLAVLAEAMLAAVSDQGSTAEGDHWGDIDEG